MLARLHAVLADVPSEPSSPAPRGAIWRLRIRLPRDAMAMGTNPLLLLDELRDLGPCTVVADTAAVPPLEALDPTDCHIAWEVRLTTDASRSAIEQVFLFVLDDMQLELEELHDTSPQQPNDTSAQPAARHVRATAAGRRAAGAA